MGIAAAQAPANVKAEYVVTSLNARLSLSELIELLEQKLAVMRGGRVSFRAEKTALDGNVKPVPAARPAEASEPPVVEAGTAPALLRP